MTTTKSPSNRGFFKRMLDIGDDPTPLAGKTFQDMSRKELIDEAIRLQTLAANLSFELTGQQERANQALRLLGALYDFIFDLIGIYATALRNFKEAGNNKPIPAMFIAARVCERFEEIFEKFPMQEMQISPNRSLLQNAYDVAMRPVNPGSNIGAYLKPQTLEELAASAGYTIVQGQGGEHGAQENQN